MRGCILITGGSSRVGEICRVVVIGGGRVRRWWSTGALDVPDGRLLLAGVGLVGVVVDLGDDGGAGAGVAVAAFAGARGGGCAGVGDDGGALGAGGFADVGVAFEDFFGGDVGVVVEEGGVV